MCQKEEEAIARHWIIYGWMEIFPWSLGRRHSHINVWKTTIDLERWRSILDITKLGNESDPSPQSHICQTIIKLPPNFSHSKHFTFNLNFAFCVLHFLLIFLLLTLPLNQNIALWRPEHLRSPGYLMHLSIYWSFYFFFLMDQGPETTPRIRSK